MRPLQFNQVPYDECFDADRKHSERLHKKNGENLAILANSGLKNGEMGRAMWCATCEHNYGVMVARLILMRDRIVPCYPFGANN